MVAKPNVLARSLPPSITNTVLNDLDQAVVRTMQERLQLTFTDEARTFFQLPMRFGGVGFCPSVSTAPHAFVAGVASSFMALLRSSNLLRRGWEPVKGGMLMTNLQICLDRLKKSPLDWPLKRHMGDTGSFLGHICDNPDLAKKLQAQLVSTVRTSNYNGFKEGARRETVARLESRNNKSTALIWKAIPVTTDFQLTDFETRFTVAYATGMTLPHMPEECHCTNPLGIEHSVHCDRAVRIDRHNRLQKKFVAFASQHCITTRENVRYSFEDAKARKEPDLIIYTGTGKPTDADVTVVNPCAPHRVEGNRRGWRTATTEAKNRKNHKYVPLAERLGHTFTPLVFETHGNIATEVSDLLHQFAAHTPGARGLAVRDMMMDLAITLAKGNAECARVTIARSLRKQERARTIQPFLSH